MEVVFETLVFLELCSVEITVAYLALDHYFWTVSFDVLEQLSPCHVLEVFMVTDVTSEFGAITNCVLLELSHCFPDQSTVFGVFVASVWELTEVNTVLEDIIDIF